MTIRPFAVLMPAALALSLAACDSRDYDAEIAELQTQLGDANTSAETIRAENETLRTELEELRAQSEGAAEGAASMGEEAVETVRSQLQSALEKASQTVDRLAALERDPDAPAETRTEAVGVLRSDVQEIVDSVQTAAAELGLELQTGVEPAAGAAQEQTQPAAADDAGQAEETPEQPADEPAQPQQ